MIRNLKTQMRFTFNYSQPSAQSNPLPYFRTEQFSNDYISSLCKQNLHSEALEAFDFLKNNTNFRIRPSTYARLISACSSLRSLEQGRKVHDHILASKCQPDIVLHNHMLNMYGKCGSLEDARMVFDDMPRRNVVSWTAVIAGYSQKGQENDAIELYVQMLQSGIMPDQFTFGSIIKACSGLGNVGLGRQLHAQVIKSEHGSHLIAQNALIAMYTKFDQIVYAWDVFSHIAAKDIISWGSIIAGFSQLGYELEALCYFKEMLRHGGYQPNEFIFGSVFNACSSLLHCEYGMQIHGMCIKFGLGRDIFAGCSLCDTYARCGLLDFARMVFNEIESPDLASWNAIIAGFASGSNVNETMSFFLEMRHIGLIPDELTVRSLLCACTSSLALNQGMQVHSYIIKMGFDSNVPVCNAMLTMYAKCLVLSDAFLVFKELGKNADLLSWNSILTACLQQNQAGEIFRLFSLMRVSPSKPDRITLTNVLGACSEIASLEMGNQVHCFIMKTGLGLYISVMNGLIDMYIKCGSLESVQELFNSIEDPDVVSWSSLIVGYAQFGRGEEALKLFERMRSLGVRPNEVTIVGVLTACSHVGLVEEGLQLYRTMETEYGIVPTREIYSCVVDLFARAGRLHEAEDFIKQMAFDPDIVVWKSLLAACKTHGNIDVGKRAAENILNIDPTNSAAHVLLCNLYASSERWGDVARLRGSMKARGVKKVPGQSWIEIKDKINVFSVEDSIHPERDKIYTILEELWLQMLDDGYFPFQKLASTKTSHWWKQ
ncbi:Pentatricopeptide repeat-containing protein [Melia azedarach]|uniref:Pentatricopeptide repeat-containing protein n=1 Tax=Melia azedarach TaxID=155640 RepID=A0ACC1X119_MELAZ|nr:Pentatricopeptide repeat-containing protein [Melia azedarach]